MARGGTAGHDGDELGGVVPVRPRPARRRHGPRRISTEVADRVAGVYRERLPLLPGARRPSSAWPGTGRLPSLRPRTGM